MLKLIAFNNIRSITLKFVVLLAPAVTLTTVIFCAIYAILNYQSENTELNNKNVGFLNILHLSILIQVI